MQNVFTMHLIIAQYKSVFPTNSKDLVDVAYYFITEKAVRKIVYTCYLCSAWESPTV